MTDSSQPPPFVPGPPPTGPPLTGPPLNGPPVEARPEVGDPFARYPQSARPAAPAYSSAAPSPPTGSQRTTRPGAPERPWWGMGDALLIIPIFIAVNVLAAVAFVVHTITTEGVSALGEASAVPIWIVAFFTLVQQLVFGAWPLLVSKWKGLGPARDWGLGFKVEDLGIGLGVAMIGMFSAGLVAAGAAFAVGLEDEAEGENLQILDQADGTIWLWVLVFTVVIVAPITEELLFRGLILQSVRNRWGSVVGVLATILAFAPLHIADGGFLSKGQVVLVAAIATLAIVFAVTTLKTGRLAASMVAHMIINSIGVAGALGLFGALADRLPT